MTDRGRTFWRVIILTCTGIQVGILIHSHHRTKVLQKAIAQAEANQTFGQVLKERRGYFWVFVNFPDPKDHDKIVVNSYSESFFYESEKLAEFAGLSYAVMHDKPVKFVPVLSQPQIDEILERMARVHFEDLRPDPDGVFEVKPEEPDAKNISSPQGPI